MAENSCSSTSSDSDIDEDTFYDSDYSDKCTCYFNEPQYTEEEMCCMRKITDIQKLQVAKTIKTQVDWKIFTGVLII